MSTNATDKGLLTLELAQRTASLRRLRARPDRDAPEDRPRRDAGLLQPQRRAGPGRGRARLAQPGADPAGRRRVARARGLATLPEKLQAREQTARAAYKLQQSIAGETDARMALLEAMGVRPTTPFRVAGLAGRALPAMVEDTAEKLVDRALAQRPDLLARVATDRRARPTSARRSRTSIRASSSAATSCRTSAGCASPISPAGQT